MKKDLARDIRWLLDEKYNGELTAAARRDLERLRRGEHVAYVIGSAPFLGARVDLSERPLIPRPETEYWVERLLPSLASAEKILDAFCGSGCIGLAVLKHLPGTRVDFADIEADLLLGVRKSARLNHIPAKRFRTMRSDVLRDVKGRYDAILANPPYIPSGRKLPRSLKQEPQRALFAGKDGLRYIRKLLKQAPAHLAENGKLIIEFDSPQRTTIGALAKRSGYTAEFHKDQYGKWRYVILN